VHVTIADAPLPSLPPINTPRLHLRPCDIGHAETFHAMTNDPGITSAVDFLPFPFDLVDAERLIIGNSDGRDCFWGVWLHDDARMIGSVGAHLRGTDEIEIGYWLAAEMRGRGFATEAVTAVLAALRSAYPSRAIFAECRPENTASWRLLEKVGFRADGSDGLRMGRKRLVRMCG
jgi:RimJ/RimL family protein N-acetyltransferase